MNPDFVFSWLTNIISIMNTTFIIKGSSWMPDTTILGLEIAWLVINITFKFFGSIFHIYEFMDDEEINEGAVEDDPYADFELDSLREKLSSFDID